MDHKVNVYRSIKSRTFTVPIIASLIPGLGIRSGVVQLTVVRPLLAPHRAWISLFTVRAQFPQSSDALGRLVFWEPLVAVALLYVFEKVLLNLFTLANPIFVEIRIEGHLPHVVELDVVGLRSLVTLPLVFIYDLVDTVPDRVYRVLDSLLDPTNFQPICILPLQFYELVSGTNTS